MHSRTRANAPTITVAVAAPRGFTLVEVLLAVILISVGLLALVAGSGVLLRQTNDLRIRRAALQAGTNRLQLLGAGSCAGASGDASGPFGIQERWSAELVGNGVRDVHDSVTFSVRGEVRTFVLRTRLPC
jgi:prepilin-type N-terminal cleavage/methylation domain-containing protein